MRFEELLDLMAKAPRPEPFKPNIVYNAGSDILAVYLSETPYVSEWISPELSVFVSANNPSRVVGLSVTGVKKLVDDTPREHSSAHD